jgi:hypothetical protein
MACADTDTGPRFARQTCEAFGPALAVDGKGEEVDILGERYW